MTWGSLLLTFFGIKRFLLPQSSNEKNRSHMIQEILNLADVRINGDRPWDIRVGNEKFYERVLAGGSLALGESYMDGWWDCEALDQQIHFP